MEKRQEQLLKLIVENYLQSAEPVGSSFLAEAEGLKLSGATIRNEMRDLEEKGFLAQPHTSAGRIPTELGYKYYIKNIMKVTLPKKKTQDGIKEHLRKESNKDKCLKSIGRDVAEQMNSVVMIALNRDVVYYTGISNLFSQAEFRDYAQAVEMSSIFDQCEERLEHLYEAVNKEVKIFIGKENPLGAACGTVVAKVGQKGLFVVIGPMRMDYGRTVGFLDYISSIF